jgi:hypothetical protein
VPLLTKESATAPLKALAALAMRTLSSTPMGLWFPRSAHRGKLRTKAGRA